MWSAEQLQDLFRVDPIVQNCHIRLNLALTGKEAISYAVSLRIDDMPSEELGEFKVFAYAAPAGVLKDRLNALGFGEALIKEAFEEELKENIEFATAFIQENSDKGYLKHVEEDLRKLQKLDYDTWMQEVNSYISAKHSDEKKVWSSDEGPFKLLSYVDQRIILRVVLEHIDENGVVTLDLTDLVDGGWFEDRDSDASIQELTSGVPIIITEGTFDVQVLKGAVEILKPHLLPYIRFLDYDFRNEGSASVAVNTLKSFAAAGISNRIVAIFDNDSAAYEAVSALKGIRLPPQYKVIHYPDIDLANKYPTLGPQGDVTMNVNRLAGSIELYLGVDVLKDDKGNLMPVQWKGYMSKIKSYQGELLNKFVVQKAFNEKLKAARTNRKNIDMQDWSGLNAILDKLIETLSNL